MNNPENIKSLSFSPTKIMAIFAIALFVSLTMGYDCHAEIAQEKAVSTKVRRVPAKRVITRVRHNVRRLDAKPPTLTPKKSEKSVEPIEYEVEVSEPVPIERTIRIERKIPVPPIYLVPESMPASVTREEIHDYIEDLKYGETIDDKIYAARTLGGGAVRQYIHQNNSVIDEVYNALAVAFRLISERKKLEVFCSIT